MPVLYFAKHGAPPVRRAMLTFLELRGMFGAYDTRYLSDDWSRLAETPACATGCVVAEIRSRDGVSQHYPRAGLYHFCGLSTVKVDEMLKFRESYSRRVGEAEKWELDKRKEATRSVYAARRRSRTKPPS